MIFICVCKYASRRSIPVRCILPALMPHVLPVSVITTRFHSRRGGWCMSPNKKSLSLITTKCHEQGVCHQVCFPEGWVRRSDVQDNAYPLPYDLVNRHTPTYFIFERSVLKCLGPDTSLVYGCVFQFLHR